jgi:DUF4097 and DUF4098 domain-containing protein YvlB
MRFSRQFSSLFIMVLFVVFASSCSSMPRNGYDEDFQDSIKKSFRVGSGGTLNIDSDVGSIEVQASSGSQVEIEVFRKVDSRYEDDFDELIEDFEINFDQRNDDVFVTGEWKGEEGRRWNRRKNRLRIKYVVSVPTRYNVDLNTSGGSISVDDLEGQVKSKTSGGSLSFGDIKGDVNGRTSGGSITLEGCNGTAEVRTSGGSIRIGDVNGNVDAHTSGGSVTIDRAGGEVIAKTSGGSINVEEVMGTIEASTSGGTVTAHISKQPKGRCYLNTSGGSIKVYLADDIGVDLDASTSGGHVETDFPVTVSGRISKRSLKAEVNDGGPEMVLRTSGGSIYLRKMK